VLALLYLTVGLVVIGAVGIKTVSHQTFYQAIWEAIAGVRTSCEASLGTHTISTVHVCSQTTFRRKPW